jgi:YD repeat-containing protein
VHHNLTLFYNHLALYAYNALGKLISQTDAKGQTSTMAYDKLGRITQRVATTVFIRLPILL